MTTKNESNVDDLPPIVAGTKQEQDWQTILDILIRKGQMDFSVLGNSTKLLVNVNGEGGRNLCLRKSGEWSLE